MRPLFFYFIAVFSFSNLAIAQKNKVSTLNLSALEDSIASISTQLATDSVFTFNDARNAQLENLLEKFLKQPESVSYEFTKTPALSILSPEDKSFRVITWTFLRDTIHNEHRGYVQINATKPSFKKLIPATATTSDAMHDVLTPETWMGALYYNIKSFKFNGEMRYLLFGVNLGDGNEKSKICDVIKIKNKTITFGSPIFVQQSGGSKIKNNRIVLVYSADTEVHLNYDDAENLIIYDHLVAGTSSNNEPILVPDGSYEAYKLGKNGWEYIEQLPTTIMSEAPRPKPLEKSSRQMYASPTRKPKQKN